MLAFKRCLKLVKLHAPTFNSLDLSQGMPAAEVLSPVSSSITKHASSGVRVESRSRGSLNRVTLRSHCTQAGMIEEMMSDSIDDAIDEDGLEEETDAEVWETRHLSILVL